MSLSVQGVTAAAPTLLPGSASFVDGGHFAATRELSPRTQAALVICLGLFLLSMLPLYNLDSLLKTRHTVAMPSTRTSGHGCLLLAHALGRTLLGSGACDVEVIRPSQLTAAS